MESPSPALRAIASAGAEVDLPPVPQLEAGHPAITVRAYEGVGEFEELEHEAKTPMPSGGDVSGKPRRPKSAYFHFCDAKRSVFVAQLGEESKDVSKVAKMAGQAWKQLSDVERAQYNAQAEADKKRYEVEMAQWKDLGLRDAAETATHYSTMTPLKFVKDLITRDPESSRMKSAVTARMMAKATDCFVVALAEEVSRRGDKKRVRLVDVHNAVYADDARFGFLAHDFKTPAEIAFEQDKERIKRAAAKPAAGSTESTPAVGGQRDITSYFKV